MENEALRDKVIEIDISLHEQKITLTTLEETMSRMVSILEKLTRIEQENAVTKEKLEVHDKRIGNLEERNKWIHRTIVAVVIGVIGQFIFNNYVKEDKQKEKISISRSYDDTYKSREENYVKKELKN